MGKLKPVDAATKGLLEPTTPLAPTQVESRRILSHAPDSDPCHRINFEWSMRDLQAWSQAEQEMRAGAAAATSSAISKTRADMRSGTFVFAGRVWWSAAGRLSSIIVLLIAIAAESLIVLR